MVLSSKEWQGKSPVKLMFRGRLKMPSSIVKVDLRRTLRGKLSPPALPRNGMVPYGRGVSGYATTSGWRLKAATCTMKKASDGKKT